MAGYAPATLSKIFREESVVNEVWKDIENYGGKYQVSTFGNVRGLRGLLKPQKRNHGYLAVWLYNGNGKANQISVHRLVAKAFIPNPEGLPEVNHIDEDKQNNSAGNLAWCSHKSNSSYGTRGAKISKSNTNGKRSRAICQYTLDGELVAVFPSLQEAHRHGYAASNICRCANGHPKYSHAYGYVWRYQA